MSDQAPLGSPYHSRAASPTRAGASSAGTSSRPNVDPPTPSRMNRLFSFGAGAPTTASSGDDNVRRDASTSSTDRIPEADHVQARTSAATNAKRRPSRTEREQDGHTDASSTLLTGTCGAQRVKTRSSFLSGVLAGHGSGASVAAPTASSGSSCVPPPRSSSLRGQTVPPASTSMIVDARPPPSNNLSTWRFPWSSAKKVSQPAGDQEPECGQSAHSVGLTMYNDMTSEDSEDVCPTTSEDPIGEGDVVLDEGISMSDTSGKVDFLTSLPLELSLYVLLFADVPSLCQAMQVSTTWYAITSDALIWRDHFYRNRGWDLRPDYLENIKLGKEDVGTTVALAKSFESQAPATPRNQRSSTVNSEGSIAARIGRRISDIVTEIGFLSLRTDQRQMEDGPADRQRSPAVGARASEPREASAYLGSPARAPTPSRTRSSTATSTAATHPSNFYTPLRTSMRQNSVTSGSGPGASRRASQSFSVVQSLLESHGSPNIHGIPLGHQVPRELDESDGGRVSPSPATPTRSGGQVGLQRLMSAEAVEAHQDTSSEIGLFDANSTLFLDWKGLYRDRHELERRWREGLFTTRIFKGHLDSVYCIALHGNLLLSGSRDQTIKVWDLERGRLARTIEAHNSSVLAIVIEGSTMVTGASNGELFVWNTDTWDVTDILAGHTAGVLDVQMDDQWIVSCSKDSSIRVWKRDTKECYRVLQGHRGPVNAIQLNDGVVCSASGDASAKLWSIETGQVIRVLKGHERGLACIQYDGTTLITGSNDRTIRIWDPSTGKCTRILKGHKDLVRTLSYDPIRNTLFSGSYDKTCRLWDLETGNPRMIFKSSHNSLIFDVTMDASRIASCSHDQTIVLTDFGEELNAHRFI